MTILTSQTSETNEQTIARLMAEVAALKAANKAKLTMKVTEKGGASLYGLGRFPVTLYLGQWERLLDNAVQIRAFLQAHRSELSVKE